MESLSPSGKFHTSKQQMTCQALGDISRDYLMMLGVRQDPVGGTAAEYHNTLHPPTHTNIVYFIYLYT